MVLIAAHLNAGVDSGGDRVAIGTYSPSISLIPHFRWPVPNKPYGSYGRKAP